jgi:hypothetical protein
LTKRGNTGVHAASRRETTMIARAKNHRGVRIAFDLSLLTAAYVVFLAGFAYLMA